MQSNEKKGYLGDQSPIFFDDLVVGRNLLRSKRIANDFNLVLDFIDREMNNRVFFKSVTISAMTDMGFQEGE